MTKNVTIFENQKDFYRGVCAMSSRSISGGEEIRGNGNGGEHADLFDTDDDEDFLCMTDSCPIRIQQAAEV